MKKVAKKTFIARVIVKSKHPENLPEFRKGLGKGVLMEQEVSFKDLNGRGFNNPSFAMAMVDFEKQIIDATVEVKWEEKKVKKARKTVTKAGLKRHTADLCQCGHSHAPNGPCPSRVPKKK